MKTEMPVIIEARHLGPARIRNMFREERTTNKFVWTSLGNIQEGRPHLGPLTSVAAYRLTQYTMRDVLIRRYGVDEADSVLHEAGKVAGSSFCKNALDTGRALNEFVADLKDKLLALKIGVLQIEKADLDSMEFILTVSEDLDCSGLPATDETVCTFDEGFIAGILGTYLGREFEVKEIDCWATGERTCRFQAVARS